MSYDSIIEVLALALLEQANEVGCLEVLDGFSQRPDTEIEVSAPISEEMLILPLDKQEWPEECAPILKESGATTLGELVEYLNHCAASGKKPNVSEDAAAAMFPALIAFCYNNADTDGKRFFWEYIKQYEKLYHYPIAFLPTPHGLLPMKCTPEQYEQFQRDGNKLKIRPIDHGER